MNLLHCTAASLYCTAQTPFESICLWRLQGPMQRHCGEPPGSNAASQLAHALQQLLPYSRAGLEMHSLQHRVLSAALKALCVLLLPPHFTHGAGELYGRTVERLFFRFFVKRRHMGFAANPRACASDQSTAHSSACLHSIFKPE